MDLTQPASTVRGFFGVRRSREHDGATAQMCFGASAGLLPLSTGGCLAEPAIGMGGHLQRLLVFSFGYFCCGLKQQASIWLAMRAVARERSSGVMPALAEGCLPHSEVLPVRRTRTRCCEGGSRSRTRLLPCI